MTGHRYKDTKHNEDFYNLTFCRTTPPSLSVIISVTWIGTPTIRIDTTENT